MRTAGARKKQRAESVLEEQLVCEKDTSGGGGGGLGGGERGGGESGGDGGCAKPQVESSSYAH